MNETSYSVLLDMSLKEICSFSVFFSDSEDEPADPKKIVEEPDDEASSSDKDVSDATGLQLFCFFRRVRSGGTKK